MKNSDVRVYSDPFIAAKNPPVVDAFDVICPVINPQYIHHFLGCT